MKTSGTPLDPIEIEDIGEAIRETQIEQTLAGLRLMPQMVSRLQDMANRGDLIAIEVMKRYNQRASK